MSIATHEDELYSPETMDEAWDLYTYHANPFSDSFSTDEWQVSDQNERRSALNYELSENEHHHLGVSQEQYRATAEVSYWAQAHATSGPGASAASQRNPPQLGYMDQPSPFALDSELTESSFLTLFPKGKATVSFYNDENTLESITDLSIDIIAERSPVLAMAFEESRSGPQLFLEVLTTATALPFLRFLYTGTYALSGGFRDNIGVFEDVPTSVLFHSQLFSLADTFDLPDLKKRAYVNIVRQCEYGCSSPEKPIDICSAIRYIYEHLRQHEDLVDTIVNYCVSCFLRHQLAKDPDFQELANDLRTFNQDLCKNVMSRRFDDGDDTALAIIQMPFKPPVPDTYASREDIDVVFRFHGDDDHFQRSPTQIKRRKISTAAEEQPVVMPFRTIRANQKDEGSSTQSEETTEEVGSRFGRPTAFGSPTLPAVDWASWDTPKLLQSPTELESSDSSDFEVVRRPHEDEVASASDSDSSEFVEVEREAPEQPTQTLPIRTRDTQAGPTGADSGSISDSDSEWTML